MPITTYARTAPAMHRARANCILLMALSLALLADVGRAGVGGQPAAPDTTALLNRLPPSWRDDHGEMLRLPTLMGQRIFVTMAYTSCHRICPMTMMRLDEIQRDLDTRGLTAEFLIVSYDPSNDDPAAWRRYRASHGLVRENWHFLSGTSGDTERLARRLGFEFWRDEEHVMHDFRIVALGDDGSWRGAIDSAHGDWQALL
ncbi:MAG TPA: SCO family protein [Steroidobacteraceae bacterium]